jgi:hypothetical protein
MSPYLIALVQIGLGERNQAIASLEQGYTNPDQWMTYLKVDPQMDDLRSDPVSNICFDVSAFLNELASANGQSESSLGKRTFTKVGGAPSRRPGTTWLYSRRIEVTSLAACFGIAPGLRASRRAPG